MIEHVQLEKDGLGERNPEEVHLSELFNIVDLAGKLMNKKEPEDDDETPYNEYLRW